MVKVRLHSFNHQAILRNIISDLYFGKIFFSRGFVTSVNWQICWRIGGNLGSKHCLLRPYRPWHTVCLFFQRREQICAIFDFKGCTKKQDDNTGLRKSLDSTDPTAQAARAGKPIIIEEYYERFKKNKPPEFYEGKAFYFIPILKDQQ